MKKTNIYNHNPLREKKRSIKDFILMLIIISFALYEVLTIALTQNAIVFASSDLDFGSHLIEVQTEYSDLYRLQKSISICEGADHKESRAYRNNNPGNLKAGGKTDDRGHTIYPNHVTGYLAHLELLQRKYWGMTPKEMNRQYATNKKWFECVNFYYYGY